MATLARRAAGTAPFTCLSCDNLADNGRLLAAVVAGFATLTDPALAAWIKAEPVSLSVWLTALFRQPPTMIVPMLPDSLGPQTGRR